MAESQSGLTFKRDALYNRANTDHKSLKFYEVRMQLSNKLCVRPAGKILPLRVFSLRNLYIALYL